MPKTFAKLVVPEADKYDSGTIYKVTNIYTMILKSRNWHFHISDLNLSETVCPRARHVLPPCRAIQKLYAT
jgi:hypothetical protein